MENKNYYIENVAEIAKIGIQRTLTWPVAIDVFDQENPALAKLHAGEKISDLREEFYRFVEGKSFDGFGNWVPIEAKTVNGEKQG